MEKIFIPAGPAESEFLEKKSRFISRIIPTDDPEVIRSIIRETRKEHLQSRHVVWAYILGDSRSIFGMSDDGEPHGTAGKPVLEVLKGSGMTDILVLVIRYFGGIKLGTGGLVSAYTRAAQDVLKQVEPLEKIASSRYSFSCPYTFYDQVKKAVLQAKGSIINEIFETDIKIEMNLPDEMYQKCSDTIRDITAGSLILPKPDLS